MQSNEDLCILRVHRRSARMAVRMHEFKRINIIEIAPRLHDVGTLDKGQLRMCVVRRRVP